MWSFLGILFLGQLVRSWSTSILSVLLPLGFLWCWGHLDVWPLSAFCDLWHLVFQCPLFPHPWHVASHAGQLSYPEGYFSVQLPHCPFGCWHILLAVFYTAFTFFLWSPISVNPVSSTLCAWQIENTCGSVQLQSEESPDEVSIMECMHQLELNMVFLLLFTWKVTLVSKVLYPLDKFIMVSHGWIQICLEIKLVDLALLRYRLIHGGV